MNVRELIASLEQLDGGLRVVAPTDLSCGYLDCLTVSGAEQRHYSSDTQGCYTGSYPLDTAGVTEQS